MAFAKLFEYEDIGQVVVINDTCEETGKPAVIMMFSPPNSGVCSLSIKFNDNDAGYKECDDFFDKQDHDSVHGTMTNTGLFK